MSDVLRFDLAKDPKGNPITYGRVGDSNGLTRKVKVFEDGKPFNLTGWATTFEGNTSNWKTKVFDTEGINIIDATKGEFSYTFPNMAFAVEGQYERAYFSFMKGDQRKSTGNFEIIVLGDSDIYAQEAETIITEYNKLVAELNELQNQAIDEMNRNFTEAQGRISELEVQINDLRNKIGQTLTDFENGNFWTKEESFNKEESSANVVYQIIGKEKVRMDFTLDFDKKIISSNVENPNWSGVAYGTNQLPDRSDFKNILSPQSRMDSLKSLNGNNVTVVTVAGTPQYPCVGIKWDVVETLTRFLGESFFADRGAVDVASKANVAKQIINNAISSNIWGYGTSPNGNDFRIANLVTGTFWQLGSVPPNNSNVVKKLRAINSSDATIQADGNIYTIAYSSQSTADKQSSIYVDYATLTFSIEVSMNEHIKSMIATYSGENINKNFVGLGNVDNYSTASQIDAEEGDASDRFMTVLRTKQQIDKRLATDAEVIAAEEPTKLITPKNLETFYEDRQKVAVARYGLSDVVLTAKDAVSDASWRYRRKGNEVEFFGRFNIKSATDIVNVHYLPNGFRLSADFDDTSWNVPLVVTKAANPTSFLAAGFVERAGTNLLRIGCNASGNTYWHGRWYTDDPFPVG